MFENSIAMASLAASDQARARTFWKDVFGLDPVRSDLGGDFYVIGGTAVLVYESQFAGTNKATAFSIMTDDLDRDMAALRAKGIVFHDYDLPGIKTENGVVEMDGERGAWFDDSEGNIISIAQPTGMSMDEAKSMLAAVRT
ncbi:VOC family protein [Agromyces aurantiacus]|uniref:VOC family protein n=1 Tax=Agromyces aurantiacus TaxID=165814 RepID=A0ABV9R606_9MICO|nr:VOC family protein [Agromyces aurantiacus]MBM7504240.1 catechol 2,3-dioxygenase-like lactoylglutathione lyase family enzyme [Agromyces aurantiacus]